MNAPKYRVDEILDVTLPAVKVTSVSGAESGEIEVLLECPSGGLYRMDIPLNVAGIRRVTPAGGEPQPGEVWADIDGVVRWACRGAAGDVLLRDADNAVAPWQKINVERGPLVRVYSPAGAAPVAPGEPVLTLGDHYRDRDGDVWTVAEEHGQIGLRFGDEWGAWARVNERYGPLTPLAPAPEQPDEPRLMLGDVLKDRDSDDWTVVVNRLGELRLTLDRGDGLSEVPEINRGYGPLTLVQRAGCRRTTKTVTAAQVRPGMVVSRPELLGGAPVRIGSISTRAAGVEVQYELLGDPTVSGAVAGGDALPWPALTLWDEIAGGAR